jgi:hypothetical protein
MDQFTKDSLVKSGAFEAILTKVAPSCVKCKSALTIVTDDRIDSESNTIPFYYTCDHYTLPLSWPDIEFILGNERLPRDFLVRAIQLDGENDPDAEACIRAGTHNPLDSPANKAGMQSAILDALKAHIGKPIGPNIAAIAEDVRTAIDGVTKPHVDSIRIHDDEMTTQITINATSVPEHVDIQLVTDRDQAVADCDQVDSAPPQA